MSGKLAAAVTISETQREILEQMIRRTTSAQRLVERAKLILASRTSQSNTEIGKQQGVNRNCVAKWRGRWQRAAGVLEEMEQRGVPRNELEKQMEKLLADAARPGTPATFDAYQIVQIVAVSRADPQECGRPITHWTPRELAEEVVQRGIVEHISPASVGRFLKGE